MSIETENKEYVLRFLRLQSVAKILDLEIILIEHKAFPIRICILNKNIPKKIVEDLRLQYEIYTSYIIDQIEVFLIGYEAALYGKNSNAIK